MLQKSELIYKIVKILVGVIEVKSPSIYIYAAMLVSSLATTAPSHKKEGSGYSNIQNL